MKFKSLFYFLILFLSASLLNAKWERISWPWNGFPNGLYLIGVIASDSKMPNIIYLNLWLNKLYVSIDNGENWSEIESIPHFSGPLWGIAARYPNIIIIGDSQNKLIVSNDFGKTWTVRDSLCLLDENGKARCPPIFNTIYYFDTIAYIGMPDGAFLSTNNGLDWIPLFKGNQHLEEVHSIFAKGDTIVLGCLGSILFSSNNGNSWEKRNNGLKVNGRFIEFLLGVDDKLYVTEFGSKIYSSIDYGTSWELIKTFPNDFHRDNKDTVFRKLINCYQNLIGFHVLGPFISSDHGKTWKSYTDGLIDYGGNTGYGGGYIAFNDKFIFRTTGDEDHGMQLYRAPFQNCEFIETEVPEVNPVIKIVSISPNPATSKITISLPLYQEGGGGGVQCSFIIYNVLGEIAISLNPQVNIWVHSKGEIEVDVSPLPPGIYYISLKAGENRMTKQFAVIK